MATDAIATITNPSSALSDHTLLIDLSTMPAAWWSQVDTSDGTKGRAWKGDGTTRLAVAWAGFDNVAETGLALVKWAGTLAASGTQQVRLTPPTASASSVSDGDTYGADNAFDSSTEVMLPLSEGNATTDGILDYSANANHGTGNNLSSADEITGELGTALEFDGQVGTSDGDGEFVELKSRIVPGSSDFTISMWMRPDSPAPAGDVRVFEQYAGFDFQRGWALWTNTSKIKFITAPNSSSATVANASDALTLDAWQHVAAVKSGSNVDFYVDGVADSGNPHTVDSSIYNNTSRFPVIAGATLSSGNIYGNFLGGLQHVRFDMTARSADWLDYQADMGDQATFWGTWAMVSTANPFPFGIYYRMAGGF